jgi:hypothetical protein
LSTHITAGQRITNGRPKTCRNRLRLGTPSIHALPSPSIQRVGKPMLGRSATQERPLLPRSQPDPKTCHSPCLQPMEAHRLAQRARTVRNDCVRYWKISGRVCVSPRVTLPNGPAPRLLSGLDPEQTRLAPSLGQVLVRLPGDKSARKDLISDATKSAKARTLGVCCKSRCMSR